MIKQIIFGFKYLLTLPHISCLKHSSNKWIIEADLERYRVFMNYPENQLKLLSHVLIANKEFRSQFYLRIGKARRFLSILLPAHKTLDFQGCQHIKEGLLVVHGDNTGFNGETIVGRNLTILHNVTLGWRNEGAPVIGNNVYIGCGCIITGPIHIGNGATISAGSVVTTNIPAYSIVMGNPAKVVGFNSDPEEAIDIEKDYPEDEKTDYGRMEKDYEIFYNKRVEIVKYLQIL